MVPIIMPVLSILLSLAITLCIETWIYMLLKRFSLKLFFVASAMNLILNTTMNVLLVLFGTETLSYWLILSAYEVGTIFMESLIIFLFFGFKYFKTLLVALIANVSSFVVGLALGPVHSNNVLAIIFTSLFFLGYLVLYALTIKASLAHR